MADETPAPRLSAPRQYLWGMLAFLAIAGFITYMSHREISRAFMANPGLNGLILGVLAVGVVLSVTGLLRLEAPARWANQWSPDRSALALESSQGDTPVQPNGEAAGSAGLLAPLVALARIDPSLSPSTQAGALESIAIRLDENREALRYLTGLLVFLGLLGTFWGLLETVGSIGDVIRAMKGGADSALMFEELKNGIVKPLSGMSLSFSASLFGLAGSLILGFLDLQLGQAQNRFFIQLEDRIRAMARPSTAAAVSGPSVRGTQSAGAEEATAAMAHLAEGVQSLVRHMRAEQQMIRTWLEAQADQNRQIRRALDKISDGKGGA